MENLVTVIANLGFPIAISVFLLVRIENKIEKLTESINQLAGSIAAMAAINKN